MKKFLSITKKAALLLAVTMFLVVGFAGCGGSSSDDLLKSVSYNEATGMLDLAFSEEVETVKDDFAVTKKVDEGDEVLVTDASADLTLADDKKSGTVAVTLPDQAYADQEVTFAVTYDGKTKDSKFTVVGYKADVDAVETLITNLPAVDTMTVDTIADNTTVIVAARDAYTALGETKQASVQAETLAILVAAEAKLAANVATKAAQEAAAAVTALITELPAVDTMTVDTIEADKTAIEAAEAALAALNEEATAIVLEADKTKLTDARAKLDANIAAKTLADTVAVIGELPAAEDLTLENADAVKEAQAAFDALTEEQQEAVDQTVKDALAAATAKITDLENAAAAAAFDEKVNALPAAAELKYADKEAIEALAAEYVGLTDEVKALVTTAETLTTVGDAMATYATAYETAAAAVTAYETAVDAVVNASEEDRPALITAARALATVDFSALATVDAEALQAKLDAATTILDVYVTSLIISVDASKTPVFAGMMVQYDVTITVDSSIKKVIGKGNKTVEATDNGDGTFTMAAVTVVAPDADAMVTFELYDAIDATEAVEVTELNIKVD